MSNTTTPPTALIFVKDKQVMYMCFTDYLQAAMCYGIITEKWPEGAALISGDEVVGKVVGGKVEVPFNMERLVDTFAKSPSFDTSDFDVDRLIAGDF